MSSDSQAEQLWSINCMFYWIGLLSYERLKVWRGGTLYEAFNTYEAFGSRPNIEKKRLQCSP